MIFSIRDLLLATVIVALGLGWLADGWQRTIREETLRRAKVIAERKFSLLEGIVHRNGASVEVDAPDQDGNFTMTVTPRE